MKLEAVAALGSRLSQLSDRIEAGRSASTGAVEAFEADAVVIWLPPESGPCRAEDIFAVGSLVPASSGLDIAGVIRGGSLERWFAARGAAVASVAPIGSAGGPFGLVAVAWRRAQFSSSRIEAFLAMIAEQLRAVLARERLAARAQEVSEGESSAAGRALRREIARLEKELSRFERAIPGDDATCARQRTIIESTSDYVFVKDLWGRYVDANSAYLTALGLGAIDVLGKRDTDLFPAAVAAEHMARDHIAQISGQTLEDEATLTLGGRRRHLLMRRSPWRNAEGHTVGVVTVATNITERKEAEVQRQAALDELRAANERMQQLLTEQMRLSQRGSGLLELTRKLTAETDAEAIYRLVLEAAERQIEQCRAMVVNCDPAGPTFSFRLFGGRAAARRRTDRLGQGGGAGFGAELLASGSATTALLDPRFRFDAALIEDGLRAATALPIAVAGRPQPVLLVAWEDARTCPAEDLWFLENLAVQMGLALKNARLYSDLRQSLLTLREAQHEVQRTQRLRALGDLASGIAHQLNNSLTSILGLTDWLLFTLPQDAAGRQEMGSIRSAALETAELVKRLRDYGRVSARPEVPSAVDIAAIVRQIPDLIRPRLEEERQRRGASHDIVMEVHEVPLVPCDASQVRELLLNLVSNGLDAMPDGGRLILRCAVIDGQLHVSVTDEGDGIPPDVMPRLFEPFFSTKGGDSLGLGLSISRSIAERHGGSLHVEAGPDRGATFVVTLPLPEASAPGVCSTGEEPGVPPPGDSLRVLLVDDQDDVLEAVADMISALGHRVETAVSGEAALALMDQQPFDVVLTDLGMPAMDGRELARRAARAHPGLRVVLVTGWAADEDAVLSPGASQVIAKPITIKSLRAVLTGPAAGVAAA